MKYMELATRMGVTLYDLQELEKGNITANIAARVGGGVTIGDIKAFIAGRADANMTSRLGLKTMAAAMDLVQGIGENGAKGIVIGLMLADRQAAS